MKMLLVNGSPRKGNTCTALTALKEGLANVPQLEITQIDAASVAIAPCKACEYCREHGLCLDEDDTNRVISAVAEADTLILATPVYWWGVSAQLKLLIDKFYSQAEALAAKSKTVGLLMVGQAATDDLQYSLISRQIQCICEYLSWKLAFARAFSADGPQELAENKAALEEIEQLWKLL